MTKKILVVEDDNLLADVYKQVLSNDGFKVVVANDYASAMTKFSGKTIALVVLDIILKGKNGFELLRDFRKQPDGDKVPIIIITGMNTQDLNMDRELMVSLNIIGIHTKSQFSINEFSGLVRAYLSKYEAV